MPTSLCIFYSTAAHRGIFLAAAALSQQNRTYYSSSAKGSSSSSRMEDEEILTKIGLNQEHNVTSKEIVPLKSFWSQQPAVIYFMRRFG